MKISVSLTHVLATFALITIAAILIGGTALTASLSDAAIQTGDLTTATAALGR